MWSNKYINIPFIDGGRSLEGADCWGLARLIYKEEFNIELPSFSGEYDINDPKLLQEMIVQHKEGWQQIYTPEEGCIVVFRMFGAESHIGVAISATQFVHAREKYASAVENFSSVEWKNRIAGYFKYRENTSIVMNAVPHPLRTERVTMQVVPGSTLQLVYEVVNQEWNISDKLKKNVHIILNGRVVPKEEWAHTVVVDTDTIEYRAVPQKEAVRLVLTIAVAYIAIQTGLAAAGFIEGAAVTAGSLGGASLGAQAAFVAASAAVTMAGGYLVNVIAPIRPPADPGSANPGSSNSQTLINGASNTANKYGAIPVILGRMRVTPPLGAQNYARFSGTPNSSGIVENATTSYLDMLLTWGYGPLDIDDSSLRVGSIALSNFEGDTATNEVRRITLDRKTEPTADQLNYFNSIYGTDVEQKYSGLVLTCPGPNDPVTGLPTGGLPPVGYPYPWDPITTPGPWAELALTTPCDKFTLALHFPQGLRAVKVQGDEAGANLPAPVTIDFEYSINGGAWQPWTTQTIGGTVNSTNTTTTQQLVPGAYTGSNSGEGGIGDLVYTPEYWTTVTNPGNRITGGAYIADGFTWTITKQRTWNENDLVQVRVRRHSGDGTEPNKDYRYTHTVQLHTLTGYKNTNPANDPPNSKIAKTALTIKASAQLNGQIEGINGLVQTWAPNITSWNSTTNSFSTYGPTSNPADLFLYVLMHSGNPQRVLAADIVSKIDIAKLQYWYSYCNQTRTIVLNNITHSYKFEHNGILGAQRSILEVLRDICAAGRASPAMIDGKWSVVIDEPKPQIVQHFTPHNSWGFESTKGLPRLPDALKIQYYDEAHDYQDAELIISYANKTVDNAELFESIQLPGVTNKGAVADHARWHLAQAKLRPEIYSLNTDIEYIVCNRGDRVKVMHDVPMWGLGSGRIKNRITSNIFELDEDVPVNLGTSYTLRVRSSTGSSSIWTLNTTFTATGVTRTDGVATVTLTGTHPIQVGSYIKVALTGTTSVNAENVEVVATTTNTVSFKSVGANILPVGAGGLVSMQTGYYTVVQVLGTSTVSEIAPSDLFLYGEYLREAQDLIVLAVEPGANKSAKLTLVDYGVTSDYNIFTDYRTLTSDIIFETDITRPAIQLLNAFGTKVPSIVSIVSDSSVMEQISSGVYRYTAKLSFVNPVDLPITAESVEAQISLSNAQESGDVKSFMAPFDSGSITFTNVDVNTEYKIRLRYVGKDGKTGSWTDFVTHTIIGKSENYQVVDSVTVTKSKRNLVITPYAEFINSDFKYYEIKVWQNGGIGDFWDSTDPGIKVFTGIGAVTIDTRIFDSPRILHEGVKYRVACRALDTSGNYSKVSALTSITLYTIYP